MNSRLICLVIMAALFAITTTVLATNGMDLEGYGPIATSMGGASMAYNNGTAAMMNNPATLSLLPPAWRLDVALGLLGPHVDAVIATPNGNLRARSKATAFFMPALGLVRKQNKMVYGLGVFGQGGMGTEYSKTSWMADPSQGANTALTEGLVNRSEVSVGRTMGAFGYDITDKLNVTVTTDFVWAGIDLQMAMNEAQFQNLANPQEQTIGTASGTLVNAFGQMYQHFGGYGISRLYHAYFDFSNDNAFTGQAMGYGFAGKLGAVYRVTPKLTFGAVYQSQTALGDLKTNKATLSMGVLIDPGIFQGQPTGSYQDMIIPVTGKIAIKDFQWPSTFGIGAAYQATARLMLAADFKYIMWSQVMKNFKMSFAADNTAENGGFAGLVMDATLFQKWEDQAVIAAGGSYRVSNFVTLRAGFNYGKNPVPEKYLNALFPAIVETHATIGGGYEITPNSQVNVSITTAFKKEATNPGFYPNIQPTTYSVIAPPVTSSHSQLNASIMFSHSF